MVESYDLFKKDQNGDPIWVETVQGDLDQVKQRLSRLSSAKPGTYLIYDYQHSRFVEPFKKSA